MPTHDTIRRNRINPSRHWARQRLSHKTLEAQVTKVKIDKLEDKKLRSFLAAKGIFRTKGQAANYLQTAY